MVTHTDRAARNSEAERLRKVIEGLRHKTVAKGCTPGEADAAAAMATKLETRLKEILDAEMKAAAEAEAARKRVEKAAAEEARRTAEKIRKAAELAELERQARAKMEVARKAAELAEYERQALAKTEMARMAEKGARRTAKPEAAVQTGPSREQIEATLARILAGKKVPANELKWLSSPPTTPMPEATVQTGPSREQIEATLARFRAGEEVPAHELKWLSRAQIEEAVASWFV